MSKGQKGDRNEEKLASTKLGSIRLNRRKRQKKRLNARLKMKRKKLNRRLKRKRMERIERPVDNETGMPSKNVTSREQLIGQRETKLIRTQPKPPRKRNRIASLSNRARRTRNWRRQHGKHGQRILVRAKTPQLQRSLIHLKIQDWPHRKRRKLPRMKAWSTHSRPQAHRGKLPP
jgi:hypothetical protein